VIAHWDEVEGQRFDIGQMHLVRIDLGRASGSKGAGLARLRVDPGSQSSAVHVHGDEEEIFYVLDGSALSWQDGETFEVGAGDCLVHRAAAERHTLVAGPDGLDVLAFGQRMSPTTTYLPRPGVISFRLGFTLGQAVERHVWEAEAEAGQLELPEPSPRRANIVNREQAEDAYEGAVRHLARSAGAARSGLNWVALPANERGAPPHCHSAEEELFVVLDGGGVLELWAAPAAGRIEPVAPVEEHELRPGHVVARPPGTRISHSLRAGDAGLTYLAYGTRDTNDVCYYPRSGKVFLRGVGVIARLEQLEYSDGEPD
jgi:uncharacterized cupin superfamily protein